MPLIELERCGPHLHRQDPDLCPRELSHPWESMRSHTSTRFHCLASCQRTQQHDKCAGPSFQHARVHDLVKPGKSSIQQPAPWSSKTCAGCKTLAAVRSISLSSPLIPDFVSVGVRTRMFALEDGIISVPRCAISF